MKARGGFDYATFRGHPANQYERDAMEQALLGVWAPRALLFMETLPKCAGAVHEAFSSSTLSGITAKLDVAHQYDDILGPQRKTWNVTQGGRHYEIEGYILAHAHSCALDDPVACAASPLMNTDMADLLDLTVTEGACVDGNGFVPPNTPAMSGDTGDGLADANVHFPPLSDTDEQLRQAAIAAHAGGLCGAAPAPSVQAAQTAFEATCTTIDCLHFRKPQAFIGGCAPGMSADDCCAWKALEHREYVNWANALATGDWGLVRCFGARHRRMHLCANFAPNGLVIRMPPCTVPAAYPDDTPAVACTDYLANPTP